MITRIILENYMSHARTVIEPAAGLTVIVGPNNCGKSAIVSALQTLCGDNDGDFMVRHGEKGCQVTVETEDGHTIAWRRKGKAVSYVLDGVEVHRVGRGNLPDDLQTLLRLPKVKHPSGDKQFDVHIADQKAPIFFDRQGSGYGRLFSTASDAEKLLEMQKRHKEKVRDARREHQRCADEVVVVDALLNALSPLDEINARLESVEATERKLLAEEQEIAALALMIQQIEINDRVVAIRAAAVQAAAPLWSPPALADTVPLDQDVSRLERAIVSLEVSRARLDSVANLSEPPAQADERSLSLLCDGITKSSSSIRRIGAIRQSLASLVDPPAVMDTQTVVDFLGRLQGAHAALASAARCHAALSDLSEPGVVEDPAPLAGLIDRIARAVATATEQRQAIADHDRNLTGLDADINAWLWANPACPTCGGATTRENLLSGAHAHIVNAQGEGRP